MNRQIFLLFVFFISVIIVYSKNSLAVNVEMKYDSGSYRDVEGRNHKEFSFKNDCLVKIEPFLDIRSNKKTIGARPDAPIVAENMDVWLAELRKDLQALSGSEYGKNETSVIVRPHLFRLYVIQKGVNLNGVVAVKLKYSNEAGDVQRSSLRGYSTKLNWGGSNSKYVTVLNMAANDLLPKMAQSIGDFCETSASLKN
jgi:hypothetical protein